MAGMMTGVPLAMRQEGWWLDEAEPAQRRVRQQRRDVAKSWMLAALILLGDVLLWDVMPGVNLALFAGCVVLAGAWLVWPHTTRHQRCGIAAGAVLSVLPLVEVVQPLSVFIALAGLSVLCVFLAGVRHPDLLRAACRLWWIAPLRTGVDGVTAVGSVIRSDRSGVDLGPLLRAWALPVAATGVFAVLLIGANPVFDRAVQAFSDWEVPQPDLLRLWFWGALAFVIWPWLVARRMVERLRHARPRRATVRREGLINAGSVTRSLVAFNLLFALQAGSDVMFLYGDVALPEGISPAAYAHRGAYPLLATALLAGLFAVLARPFAQARAVRVLMMLWLAQTLALVVASVWRLDLYVEAYGLTRLRLAAYIWMGVVAAGLVLVAWQVWHNRQTVWMLVRAGVLGAVTLYACAYLNFDGVIARHNLAQEREPDMYMLCRLSEGAVPALVARYGTDWRRACVGESLTRVFEPVDWREWGFRNWRVRNSLAAMQSTDASAR